MIKNIAIKNLSGTGMVLKLAALVLLVSAGVWMAAEAGIKPILTAVIIVFFSGLIRLVFRIICLVVSAGILIWLISAIA